MQLTRREYDILLKFSQTEPQLQSNFYFVYDGMPRDMMVRVRQKGDDFSLCYKRRLSDCDNVTVCDEREREITAEHAGYILQRGVTVDEMRVLLDVKVNVPLRPVGRFDTYRAKFSIENWTVELDKNEYLGRTDYELECENNDVLALEKLKNYLYYTFGVVVRQSKPKSERFFDALKNETR